MAGETNRVAEIHASGPVFKHLGRLVSSEDGVDQFAGSSTGVHFTLSAQTKYQAVFSSSETFPEPIFSLQLLGRCKSLKQSIELRRTTPNLNLKAILSQPQSYYLTKVDRFLDSWSPL